MAAGPAQRTLAHIRREGGVAEVVERWNPHAKIRQDLFGCIDIVAVVQRDGVPRILGIQATTATNMAARMAKARQQPQLSAWLEAGGLFEVWGWSKNPNGRWIAETREHTR